MNYAWPGNIRELKNMIERLMNIVQSNNIEKTDIQFTDYVQVSHPDDESHVLISKIHKINFKEEIQKRERILNYRSYTTSRRECL